MTMVGGLDLHRRQITFDVVEVESGLEWRGRIWQPDRERFRRWLGNEVTSRARDGRVALAVEGCTGWRYVAEEIAAAGFEAHLAEPADTQAARGRKRRAKTDRTDARLLRSVGCGRFAGELDPTDQRVGVARTGAAVCVVGQPAHGVVSTHPCRALPTWCGGSGGSDPHGQDPSDVGRRSVVAVAGGPATRRGRLSDDQRDRHRSTAAQTRPDPLRNETIGVSSVGQRPIRHRRTHRGRGVDRARRLPTLLPLRTSRTPHRPGRHRRCLRPAPRGRIPVTPRTRNAALGALRSSQELLTSTQSRSRLLDRLKGRHDGKNAAISMARKLARRSYHVLRNVDPRSRLRDARLITARTDSGGWHRPPRHQGHPRSAPATGVPASVRAGRPSNTDATALPTNGAHPITIVVADDHIRRAPR